MKNLRVDVIHKKETKGANMMDIMHEMHDFLGGRILFS